MNNEIESMKEEYIAIALDKINHALGQHDMESRSEECWFRAEDVDVVELTYPEYLNVEMGWVNINFYLALVKNYPPYVLDQLAILLGHKSRDSIHVIVDGKEIDG